MPILQTVAPPRNWNLLSALALDPRGEIAMADDRTGLEFKAVLLAELERVGHDGVRVTPVNVVAVGELIQQD